MTVRVLAISSSPRRLGNSETMLDAAVEGARSAGAGVEKVVLADLGFQPCRNCGGCAKSGRCVLGDEYSALNEKLRAADRILLASPIYFASLSAQAKCLIDRGQPFWVEKYLLKLAPAPRATERRALLVSCCGFRKGEKFLKSAEAVVKVWLLCQDVNYAGAVFESGVDAKGAILQRPEALERCRSAGAELGRP